jgi:tetratricopeptide (TPR) repeat protein
LDYALLLLLLRDCPSAKKMLEAALPWLERVADAIADPQAALDLAVGRDALGEVLRELGDAQSARKLHSLAIESLTQLAGESPTKAEYRLRQALNRSYFGQAASATNSVVEATEAWAASERLLDELIQQANAGGASSAGDLAGYRNARGFVRTHRGYQLWRQADEAAAKTFGDALADFRFAAEVASPAPDHVHDLAWFYVKCPIAALRDSASAVRLATSASSAVPANVTFLGTLGAAQVRAESYAVGAETLRRALDARSPGDPRDWMFLAVAQARLNQPDQARQSWDKGLKRLGELCPANVELRALEKEFAPLFGDAP